MTKIYVFPGQGSQAKGMARDLFARFPHLVRQADEQLGYSLKTLCLEDPGNQLRLTQFTQPALYVVNALMYLHKRDAEGRLPDAVAGHSLGEYNALFAAGAFDFMTGLKLVQRRGLLMSRVSNGGMLAVVGLPPARVLEVLERSSRGSIDVANYNSHEQTVLAGPLEDLTAVGPAFEAAGARAVVPLNVSAPFHSRYMQEAAREFADFVSGFSFSKPRLPVISNRHARPYPAGEIAQLLVEQISSPVRWLESVEYLSTLPEAGFEEVGPGEVLSRLVKQIQRHAPARKN